MTILFVMVKKKKKWNLQSMEVNKNLKSGDEVVQHLILSMSAEFMYTLVLKELITCIFSKHRCLPKPSMPLWQKKNRQDLKKEKVIELSFVSLFPNLIRPRP